MNYLKNTLLFYLFFDLIFFVRTDPDSTGYLLTGAGGGHNEVGPINYLPPLCLWYLVEYCVVISAQSGPPRRWSWSLLQWGVRIRWRGLHGARNLPSLPLPTTKSAVFRAGAVEFRWLQFHVRQGHHLRARVGDFKLYFPLSRLFIQIYASSFQQTSRNIWVSKLP